jgi:hypothetical protein
VDEAQLLQRCPGHLGKHYPKGTDCIIKTYASLILFSNKLEIKEKKVFSCVTECKETNIL